jgi:hypothetical protein
MVRKNEDFSKARILVFYLPTNPDEVYIQSTIQPKDGPVISSLNQKRVAYLNRVALDEKRREVRLDALATIFAGFDYKYYAVEYPCESRQMMYRQVERLYAKLSAEQMERNRIACRKYREKNLEKENARVRAWIHKNHARHLARRRALYHHHASRCKSYHPTKSAMEGEIAFGVKKGDTKVSFD